jgi:hypothetical protein
MSAASGRVLIGSAEALAAPEVAWSLLGAGFEVHVFGARGGRPSLRRCAAVTLHEVTSPGVRADEASADLQALIDSLRPDTVMPLDDRSMWLCDRIRRPSGVRLAGPTGAQAALAIDKRLQLGAAISAGLSVPATRFCASARDALAPPPRFPVMVKPAFAIERQDGRLMAHQRRACADRAELEAALEAFPDGVPFFLQPYISGVGEGLFGLARDGEVVRWSAHRRVRMMHPEGSGSSACVPALVDDALADAAGTFLRAARWNGIFMIEVLRDAGGQPWFIELNGRAWGSMALARRMGFEYPAWAVRAQLDDHFDPPAPPPREPILCRHLGREIVHLMIVLRGRRSKALTRWPSRASTLRDVLRIGRRDRWYNLRRGGLRLFVEDTIRTVAREIRGALWA